MERLLRRLHRLHRALGSVLCVLMASWFLSGAVMIFARFPYYKAGDRLADLAPIGELAASWSSPALQGRLSRFMREPGAELSLTRVSAQPRVQLVRWGAVVETIAVDTGLAMPALQESDARRIVEEVSARACSARALSPTLSGGRGGQSCVLSVERLTESDQWTVPLPGSLFPLFHARLDDAAGSELYLSAASGAIVQRTTRKARILAWFGAIPHWIYPTILRRERVLWRNVVIALAGFGLVLTVAGLIAGVDSTRRVRLKRRRQPEALSALKDRSLRLHQRLGLAFGALALCWLFSGILSFNPGDWTQSRGLAARAEQRLRGEVARPETLAELPGALAACQRELEVRELRVRSLTGRMVASCLAADGARRVIVLAERPLRAALSLPAALLAHSAQALAGPGVRFSARHVDRADQYYYPTHAEPELVLPILRVDAEDEPRMRYYVDPGSGELLRSLNARQRLERYLYHGLHSWDFAFLYAQRGLWRVLMLSAMAVGASLALLGLGLAVRRITRRQARARRWRRQRELARAVIDEQSQSLG